MIETRKSETRYTTSDPAKMLGKYLTKSVYKTWTEDFIDEDTGETVSIERHELLFNAGDLIDQNLLARIRFSMQADDVKQVEVSNQRRMASEYKSTSLHTYMAKAVIKDKSYNFLLYADGIRGVLDILTDYIELNYDGGFYILQVKRSDVGTVLEDTLPAPNQDNSDEPEESVGDAMEPEGSGKKKYYQIAARIAIDGNEMPATQSFIVHTLTVDRAMEAINAYLAEREHDEALRIRQDINPCYVERRIIASVEEAKAIAVTACIPLEFSRAYQAEEKA